MGGKARISAAEALAAGRADAASMVIGPVARPAAPTVVFYRLCRKFVDEDAAPAAGSDILYYTLAVGHHTGVIDCFDERHRCPEDAYRSLCGLLPAGSPARWKLEGVLRSGEVQVAAGDLDALEGEVARALEELCARDVQAGAGGPVRGALAYLADAFAEMRADAAVYLMVRMRLP